MAPHDLGTCGASVASSSSSVRSPSRRSLRGTAGDAPTRSPSASVAPNDETVGNQECGNEAAGQRRRNRALKLRQTRNRNAAINRPQCYMSAEDSDDEEEDVKPDLSSLCGEEMAPGTDKQAWKKQQRMIRNRESAALSRKRKRDRIEFLEQQVAGLVDENRGLKHRLAKYEASPQMARYKYARQTAASAAPRPGPVDGDGMKHNWPTAKPTAVSPKREAGGAGVPFDGRDNGHSLPAVETTAHGLNATIAGADRRRTSVRQSARRTARSRSGSAAAAPPRGLPPAPALDSIQQASPFSYSARLAVTPQTAPAAALPRPLVMPSLRAVKVELSSSSSDYDDDDDDRIAGPAVVLDGYSSCSTLDDLSSAAERPECSVKVGGLQQEQQQMVTFDRDDDAACDNLLLDILSGDGQGQGGDDGFLSLLADDMIVDPSCTTSETSPEPLQGLDCFVKEETRF